MIKCKSYSKYTGQKEPRCNKGHGCVACWKKYMSKHQVGLAFTGELLSWDDLSFRKV